MGAFDQLDVVAEIAAALLGFFAVFLALSKGDGRFSDSDRHFIQAIVLSASIAIVLALLPRALSFHIADTSVWTTASAVGIVLGGLAMGHVAWRQLRMPKHEAALVHWGWHIGAWSLALLASTLLVLAAINDARAAAFFVSGVSAMVPLGLFCFIGVVFRRFF